MATQEFQKRIKQGIPHKLPGIQPYDVALNHAPKRKDVLSAEEKKLAVKNALRYFRKSALKVTLTSQCEFEGDLKKFRVINLVHD